MSLSSSFHYYKYHGLGNDYLVIPPSSLPQPINAAQITLICDYHHGLGSDGILYGPFPVAIAESEHAVGSSLSALMGVCIYNPDGSEAEKSGNGLRIFTRHLWRLHQAAISNQTSLEAILSNGSLPPQTLQQHPVGQADDAINALSALLDSAYSPAHRSANHPANRKRGHRFYIDTKGGITAGEVMEASGERIRVAMGKARFMALHPVSPTSNPASPTFVTEQIVSIDLKGEQRALKAVSVDMGNPHCVVIEQGLSLDNTCTLGPMLEHHPLFPNRTNVQFMERVDPKRIRIQIWERGAGHTLASGSSACASACAAIKLGWCQSPLTVEMEGGELVVHVTENWQVMQEGNVSAIGHGYFDPQFIQQLTHLT